MLYFHIIMYYHLFGGSSMENFSKRLKAAMKDRGFNQADLANATNLDRGAISRYVRGDFKPKAKNIILIADALKVNVPWLLGDEEVPMEIDPTIEYHVSDEDINARTYIKLEYSDVVEMNVSREEWDVLFDKFDTLNDKSKIDIMKYIYLIFTMDDLVKNSKKNQEK